MQVGKTPYFESEPGQGKSSIMHAIAKWLEREMYLFIGSSHAPEDFSGIPFPSKAELDDSLPRYFDMIPARFAVRFSQPGAFCFFDEITTVPPNVRAPILSVLTERKIGNLRIHPETIFCCAGNPVHMAPNASPLEKSFANRLIHFPWKMDFESWTTGMMSESGEYPLPWVPKVPADWTRLKAKYGGIVSAYLTRNPGDKTKVPADDSERAYPTYRSWEYLRDLMCAAEAVGAPAKIEAELCEATVGKVVGPNFLQFRKTYDLVDPEAVLDGKAKFKFDRRRIDLAATLLVSIVSCIRNKHTIERMDRAVEVFVAGVGDHSKDLALSQLRHLLNAKPKGESLSIESINLIKEFGKNLPG
jgi:hypothetical protein